MRVIIFGSRNGFIGGRVARYLEGSGVEVIEASYKILTEDGFLLKKEYKSINLDVADIIIYAAGPTNQICSLFPEEIVKSRSSEVNNLIKLSKNLCVKKIIYLSSAHVYSKPLTGLINENSKLENSDPYAISHQTFEKILLDESQGSALKVVIPRLANVYGIPANKNINCWELVINNFCKQAVKFGQIEIKSNVGIKRCFLSIRDLENFIGHLCFGDQKNLDGIINFGSKNIKTLGDAATYISNIAGNILGKSIQINFTKSELSENFVYESNRINFNNCGFDNEEINNMINYLINTKYE